MSEILLGALVAVSVVIIILVVMQPSKSNAASSLTGGGNGDPQQGKTKARGFEAFLIRSTVVFGVLFFALALVLAYLSTK